MNPIAKNQLKLIQLLNNQLQYRLINSLYNRLILNNFYQNIQHFKYFSNLILPLIDIFTIILLQFQQYYKQRKHLNSNQTKMINSLSTAFKLHFKMLNPYLIKPQFQLLSPANQQILIKLIEKNQVNYDSYILRFALPEENKCLGLKIGQHVQLHLNGDKKNYVPISRIDDPGTVDFLIRDMGQVVGQRSFSKRLVQQLKQGSSVTLKGPKSSFIYHGYGQIQTEAFNKKFKNIGIVAYETGITATYSLIESIYNNQDNQTGVSLVWLGKTMKDFIFMDELGFIAGQSKLFMTLMLTQMQKGFPGMVISQMQQKWFKQYLPPASQDTCLFLAGTTQQVNRLKEIAQNLGYKYIV